MGAMTEDKARKKFCPLAFNWDDPRIINCVASDCMAWRWDTEKNNALAKRLDPYNDGSRRQQIRDNKTGRCGLAGKP